MPTTAFSGDTLYARVVSTRGAVRYVPVGIHHADVFPPGAHLVVVSPRHPLCVRGDQPLVRWEP